ncbi:MAG: NAD(P)/FAD-dependent oxidoreductase [Christensenellaceae bacterium]|jgi:dihydrolipoamide dehydrogenase|nr:NAD(P)/FAD-dependent oxidoreductase [Christensenellaceae bacterium]
MSYDLIVIGGGPAGYHGAERAADAGLKVLLVEKARLGGTCLNVGCIPTKSLLYAAKLQHHGRLAGEVTQGGSVGALDQKKVLARKDDTVRMLIAGIEATLRKKKVDIRQGEAAVLKTKEALAVEVGGERFETKNILLATGSQTVIPPIEGIKEAMLAGSAITSDEILSLEQVPERLAILGAGVIGMEMAAYYAAAGSKVAVIEMLDKTLGENDREISAIVQKNLEAQGVVFHLSSRVFRIGNGALYFVDAAGEQELAYDTLLVAVGRRASANIRGLEEIGVFLERGAVACDEGCHTNAANVYAAGDVTGKYMLAHVGYRESEAAVNNMLGKMDRVCYDAVPAIVYTSPEAAFVGVSEERAKELHLEYEVKKASANMSGRSVTEGGLTAGVCKLILDKKKGIIIGGAVASAYASEYCYSLALMIQNRIPVQSILRTVFPHPTVCELIREALLG